MNRSALLFIACLTALATLATGCGRPPAAGGGPPEDYQVMAVVAPVNPRPVDITLDVVGGLTARNAVDVVSEIPGIVADLLFTEGATVQTGDILVRLDDEKLKARLAEAEARFTLAATNFRRSEELRSSGTISSAEFDQAQAEFSVAEATLNLLRRELADTVIAAPFTGVIGARLASPGQFVTAGEPITRLTATDPLEAEFQVAEQFISRLKTGQTIALRSIALPDQPIAGTIFFIDPALEPRSRTALVKAVVPNPDGRLKPGLFGTVSVLLERRANALVIPEASVRYTGDQASVVVMNTEDRAEFRNVTVGTRFPGEVEIVEGLAPGERVVVEGFQKMGPGTGIMISPESARYGLDVPPPPEPAG
jgi:membrane fusion protein (multidrug efflux system)